VDVWIGGLADEAIAAVVREDNGAERRVLVHGKGAANATRAPGAAPQSDPGREHGTAFAALARPLGLEPRAMGRACLAFNRLPLPERRAFHALVIAGRSLDEIARESGESATDIARRARRALDAILLGATAGTFAPVISDNGRNVTSKSATAKTDEGVDPTAGRSQEVHS
jgi:hypothetical protein